MKIEVSFLHVVYADSFCSIMLQIFLLLLNSMGTFKRLSLQSSCQKPMQAGFQKHVHQVEPHKKPVIDAYLLINVK